MIDEQLSSSRRSTTPANATGGNSGFTPQYTALQALHDQYKDQGLVVIGFPCDQFGGQVSVQSLFIFLVRFPSSQFLVSCASVFYYYSLPLFRGSTTTKNETNTRARKPEIYWGVSGRGLGQDRSCPDHADHKRGAVEKVMDEHGSGH
jgi:hypothetical protein